MNKMRNITFVAALAAMLLPVLMSEDLRAENLSSPWVVDQYTKSRLFVGGYDKENNILRLGWQLSLKAGWKTYWRSPGDAGLPPRWTWKDQKNIRSIAVSWPMPERLHIFGMDTYIYHHEVILPIDLVVVDEKKPVSIALDVDYLICEEICIPQVGSYRLEISSPEKMKVSLYQKAKLDRYAALVPAKVSGKDVVVRLDRNEKNSLLIELPEKFNDAEDLIVEGPGDILFGAAAEVRGEAKKQFKVIYNGKKSLEGQALTLTILSGKARGVEMKVAVRP